MVGPISTYTDNTQRHRHTIDKRHIQGKSDRYGTQRHKDTHRQGIETDMAHKHESSTSTHVPTAHRCRPSHTDAGGHEVDTESL